MTYIDALAWFFLVAGIVGAVVTAFLVCVTWVACEVVKRWVESANKGSSGRLTS